MYHKGFALFVMIAFMTVMFGCASVWEEQANTEAVSSMEPKEETKEIKREAAAAGGYLGFLTADSIGPYSYERLKTGEDTIKKYKRKPSQGILVRIENVSAVPKQVKAGERVEIRTTYALIGAPPSRELNITETWEVSYKGTLFTKPKVHVNHGDGTYSSRLPITTPPDAKKGTYKVVVTVQTQKASSMKEITFSLR
jgi:hypothetical protein